MQVKFRLPHWTGLLLLAASPFAGAQWSLPEPIAPAVIGRPLDQIRPVRPQHHRAAIEKAYHAKPVATSHEARPPHAHAHALRQVAAAPAAAAREPVPLQQQVAKQDWVQPTEPATQATQPMPDSGQGLRLATRPLGLGAYFSSKDQMLVRRYYASHPVASETAKWKIGERIPPDAAMTGVPDDVRAALPPLPPGHQYVQLDDEVVLVAVQSRVVVDGVSRASR